MGLISSHQKIKWVRINTDFKSVQNATNKLHMTRLVNFKCAMQRVFVILCILMWFTIVTGLDFNMFMISITWCIFVQLIMIFFSDSYGNQKGLRCSSMQHLRSGTTRRSIDWNILTFSNHIVFQGLHRGRCFRLNIKINNRCPLFFFHVTNIRKVTCRNSHIYHHLVCFIMITDS